MAQQGGALSPASARLVELGDLDELTRHVNGLVAQEQWVELGALRDACRSALDRGKQLWAVSAHIEYRLCLEAPGAWAALMLESGSGRFALGPLAEVASSTHTWAELSAHLDATPQAAMAAHERVLRGDDLTADPLARALPEVLDLPWRLQAWEPAYALAEYHAESMEATSPPLPPLRPVPASRRARSDLAGRPHLAGRSDVVCTALEELVSAWTAESNGRAVAARVAGGALDAVSALGARASYVAELTPAAAMATMAWAGASGGAYGRRRGAAAGRFAAWWVVAAVAGLTDQYPLVADDVGRALEAVRWFAWGSGEPVTGWAVRLALEVAEGPARGSAWAVAATDAS